jgi:two-component system, sensor histidine kinase
VTQSLAATGPTASPSTHVLIVEDYADGRDTLRLLLELSGFRVAVAANGPEGLAQAVALRPRVALIDIGLPGLDGYEVARRIRQVLGDTIRLAACTAYGQPEDR